MSGAETNPPRSAVKENHRQITYGATYNEVQECYDWESCYSSDADGELGVDDGYDAECEDKECNECGSGPEKYT
ncbi:hypothetical protein VSDG_02749 [Cytospora chrysosperma]|uniref:Uncharacterized protein n=1 Tax=Cytospora chrysosperma TaxID=252740 RepID=A0A423WCA8_CYTCH|nr:hypothetical protein VSDG_02749 [Valsa sordida]